MTGNFKETESSNATKTATEEMKNLYTEQLGKMTPLARWGIKEKTSGTYTKPTWLLTINRTFDAAHHIPGYNGKCKDQHGHTYHVTYYFHYTELNELGMAIDFTALKDWLKQFEDYWLDHKDLNEKLPKEYQPPTAEHIAKFIYDKVKTDGYMPISRVELQETPNYGVTYFEALNL